MKRQSKILFAVCLTLLFIFGYESAHSNQLDEAQYLSPLEKEIVREINLARTSPEKYASFLEQFKKYYDGKLLNLPGEMPIQTKEGTGAVDQAIRFLRSQKPVIPLRPSRGMSLGARDHVMDLGPSGTYQHKGRDGSQPWDRVNRYGAWQKVIGENISLGSDTPRNIVMGLIVDDGAPGRGHRKNTFHPDFQLIGVACGHHAAYRTICVITFAGGYKEKN